MQGAFELPRQPETAYLTTSPEGFLYFPNFFGYRAI